MNKKIQSALISVFYKDGLEPIVRSLAAQGIRIYSTGGTQSFIEGLGLTVTPVETLTGYPSILGGRVKTLHPVVFGGILGKRADEIHLREMNDYQIPAIDLVIVDLYPFEETVASTTDEKAIIEKVDIGGPSMIRAAAKNFSDVVVVAAKSEYGYLDQLLREQQGSTTLDQRKEFAARAFNVVAQYDIAIANYFNAPASTNKEPVSATTPPVFYHAEGHPNILRYGENPHQSGVFYGNLSELFEQRNGKELSYNNLVDVDAALQLIREFITIETDGITFAIIKHTNVCGIAQRSSVKAAWDDALAGDPESAFGGVLVANGTIDLATAEAINEIFFEVLIAPSYEEQALALLRTKKNRILLASKNNSAVALPSSNFRSLLNGVLVQDADAGNFMKWEESGGRDTNAVEKQDLAFANLVCKHLKSNAIALVKNRQLIGKGCGQTSRIDSLRQAIEKAKQFSFDLNGAVMASDAFFPFDDCVKMGHAAGIQAFIQPGGSIRDKDSIAYCQEHQLAMVITGLRHFKH